MNAESPAVTSPIVTLPVTSQFAAPAPTQVTPELLAQHSITSSEYEKILAALGRVPSLTELGIYSVMWSEHCSYKSSRVHLKRLPTKSKRVVQGPGENAGIIDVGDGWGTITLRTSNRFRARPPESAAFSATSSP
jgi:phosphoribosylformylglycinamidine (FGAM) synthase-like enzyme